VSCRRYGRGSRESASRTARALAETPISSSSAAACTTVDTISGPEGGAGRRDGGFGGVPAGCFGCRSGSVRARRELAGRARPEGGRGAFASARVRPLGPEAARLAGFEAARCFGAASLGFEGASVGLEASPVGFEAAPERFSLRRCGRLCGRPPRISGGFSSLTPHMMAYRQECGKLPAYRAVFVAALRRVRI
jgi:hypothetical protein